MKARDVARRFVLRIRTQAVLLSVVPLIFLLALFVLASFLQNRSDRTAVFAQRSTTILNEFDAVQTTLTQANESVAEFARRGDPSVLGSYRAAPAELSKHFSRITTLEFDDPAQQQRAEQYRKLTFAIFGVLKRFVELTQAGKKTDAQKCVETPRTRALAREWDAARYDFGSLERRKALQQYEALHGELSTVGTLLILISLAGISLTVALALLFGFRIARRLMHLAENARRLERGDPTAVISGGDEIADLDRVYHEISDRLRETLQQKDEALVAYQRAQNVASTLQRALLPQDLPHVAGVAFDAVYYPGGNDALVGGDWYDAVALADGRILITVGDVSGSGLQAAVIMAAMRQVIRGVAQVYADPATIVDAADRTLKAEHPDWLVTTFVGVYDSVVHVLSYCSAGHPPPMLRRADGKVIELPSRGLPLGLRDRGDADTRIADIPSASTLVFYTDGLIESTQDVLEGERRSREALADPKIADRPDLAQALYDAVLHGNARDDVVILTMRVDPVTPHGAGERFKRWTFETSDVATAQKTRGRFASALAARGMSPDEVFTAELIFGELLSNAVRYAPGQVDVVLDARGSSTILHVLDRGPGFVLVPRLPTDLLSERGRGLFLVWTLSEDFNVTRRPDGGAHTRVVLSRRIAPSRRRQASATQLPAADPVGGASAITL